MTVPARVADTAVRVAAAPESCPRAVPLPSSALARPKSSTFTSPSGVTLTLAGLRSRWMTPLSCAASSASAICRAMPSASTSGIGPRLRRSDRSSPSTSSITSAVRVPDSSRPWMPAMCGWLSEASTCASRWKRAIRSLSFAKMLRQELQRDLPVQPRVGGAKHLSHATSPELAGDAIVRDGFSNHWGVRILQGGGGRRNG